MKIREALGQIAALSYIGNKAGSIRTIKDFERAVSDILRCVDTVVERPNGNNAFPALRCQGVNYVIKTAKGLKPMWNEAYVRTDSVVILNLKFGTVVVHGSLITTKELTASLIEAKEYVAQAMRDKFPQLGSFFVTGGRVQFGDNIDWEHIKISSLNQTITILEDSTLMTEQ